MVQSEPRYFLRLESGERSGEAVPIPHTGLTLGRRPENGLQLSETSISGRHAELLVDGEGVLLRDLGSTNGTRVAGERIEERRLAHGDELQFGSLRARFVDGALDAAPGARAAGAAPQAEGEALQRVTTERLATSGRRGLGGLLGLVLLAAAAGAAYWFTRKQPKDSGTEAALAQAAPARAAGELLADGAFEDDAAADWEPYGGASGAGAAFARSSEHRSTGEAGLCASLEAGGFAGAASPAVSVRPRRALELSARLAVGGAAEACLGLELHSSEPGRAPVLLWAPPRGASQDGGFEPETLRAPALEGYDLARIVVLCRAAGEGRVALDDASLVEVPADGDAQAPAVAFEGHSLHCLGDPASTALLLVGEEPLLSGLRFEESTPANPAEGAPRFAAGGLSAEATPTGVRLTVREEGARLAFTVHLAEGALVATLGSAGYRAFGATFAAEPAERLLVAQGARLLCIKLAREVPWRGTFADGALRVETLESAGSSIEVQLAFREERLQAAELAADARDAGRRGDVGAALSAWSGLLDRFPFEAELVGEAERERARLLDLGDTRLRGLRADFERARFFGLTDLFERCHGEALELAERYRGTDPGAEALALAQELTDAASAGAKARADAQRARLEAIQGVVERNDWKALSARLGEALEKSGG
jgi:hypothetical protein